MAWNRRFTFTREFYIPAGSIKVVDKASDAVAYITDWSNGKVRATIFFGNQAKPISDFTYRDAARRAEAVKKAFEQRQAWQNRKVARRNEIKNFVHDFKVGDVLYTSWGYDQTNIDYYQVTEVRGKMLTVRAIGGESKDTGYMTGESRPVRGNFLTGRFEKTFRVIARGNSVKVDGHYASKTDTTSWHRWSSYA